MEITRSKMIALLIAIGYVIVLLNVSHGPAQQNDAILYSLFLLVPLALIWFPDLIGSAVGGGRGVNAESPPLVVAGMGWLLLLGAPVAAYFLWK